MINMKLILSVLLLNLTFFTPVFIKNSSYILYDMEQNRILKGSNVESELKTASISKIMTAILAIEEGNLDSYLEITESDNAMDGSKVYLDNGDKILLYEAIHGLILRSGNDLANAISKNVMGDTTSFIEAMNQKAKAMGLKNTVYINPSGLGDTKTNTSSALDMAKLVTYATKNQVFKEVFECKTYSFKTLNKKNILWHSKHRLVSGCDELYGGKTGFTKASGRTLVSTLGNKVVVSFNIANDFSFHKELLNQPMSSVLVYKEAILDYEDLAYIPYTEDIYLEVKEEEKDKIRFFERREESDIYIDFYLENALIYEVKIKKEERIGIDAFIRYVFMEMND